MVLTLLQIQAIALSNQQAIADILANVIKVPNLNAIQQNEFHVVLDQSVTIDGFKVFKTIKSGDYTTIEIGDRIEGKTADGWDIIGVPHTLPYDTYDSDKENYPNMHLYQMNAITNN